jgi:7-keto-8-aminopelargonate synthetase-like enzyme
VPHGAARLRVAFAAGHPDAEVDRLAAAVGELI